MRNLTLWLALLITGCQTNQQAISPGEQTFRCSVSDYGQVNCEPEWHFKKKQ